jgi:YNFM family putative membrane transporter
MGWYVSSLVAGGLVGRVGVALATPLVGWRVAIGALALLPAVSAVAMRGAPVERQRPQRSGSGARVLVNRRLLLVTVAGSAVFFTFVGVFSFVVYRLQEPPFSYGTGATGLVFLLWAVGLLGSVVGRVAERVGWRRLVAIAIAVQAAGVAVTVPDALPVVLVGLTLVAAGMFVGYTAAQLGVGDVARVDRGTATALYFSVYYCAGALGAYVPGLAWERWGWSGVVACGLAAPVVGLAAVLAARPSPRGVTPPAGSHPG